MKIQKLAALLPLLSALLTSNTWANCGDTICSVDMGNGETSYIDYALCSLGTQPLVTLTDAQGNLLKGASGQETVLPSTTQELSSPSSDGVYILAGFWSDSTGTRLKFIDGAGAQVFFMELVDTASGMTGTLTSLVPGLVVTGATVSCLNP